jgi:hypothetical protein
MPMGLTGAPSTFSTATGGALGDLVGTKIQLFVDDGGMAGDDFNTKMGDLRQVFQRVREHKLSLSAAKMQFFMTEAMFAGNRVGPDGIKPDLTKLTAIVDWQTPHDLLNLKSFLGLCGHFRGLIKNYARIAQPLTDLERLAKVDGAGSKGEWRRRMRAVELQWQWGAPQQAVFVRLKAALTSELVLRGLVFDGQPFVVMTDGSKGGFGGMLCQRFDTTMPGGKVVSHLHPIGFTSKCTSLAEERYKPYLLEFAALKYSLDKFADTTYGFPIEIETDCQALRDTVMSTNLSTTHARWLEAVMGHDIREIRHLPGAVNFVGDALSRKYTNVVRTADDGSAWSVECDWFAGSGLVFNLYTVADAEEVPALKARFAGVPVFLQAIEALDTIAKGGSESAIRRAKHRAREYMMEGGKLWHVGGGRLRRARARVECLTPSEMKVQAEREHREGGHMGRDSMKLKLTDRFKTPAIDQLIMGALQNCGECLNFGSTHLHALLQPITRRHLFELLVGDYLAMPKGHGGYKEIGLYLDTASQRVFGFKYKTHGSAVTTKGALESLFHGYAPWETFQTDGRSHFDNKIVRRTCGAFGVKPHVVAKYSPWVDGLVEGTNRILLGILKWLCAPDLGEEGWKKIEKWEHLPNNWPDHFDNAIFLLNNRILRALDHTPNELFFAMVINTAETGVEAALNAISMDNVDTQQAYAGQQRFDGYARAV